MKPCLARRAQWNGVTLAGTKSRLRVRAISEWLFALWICILGALSINPPIVIAGQAEPHVLVGAGDIASCRFDKAEATAKLLDKIPGTVFTVGDNVYRRGSYQEFIECYGLSWGRHRWRTRPAPGNHEYKSPQAEPYFKYFGVNAGPRGRGFYSYELSGWHILSLNSNSKAESWGKEQENWLRQELAANRSACKLAYWHHPLISSGRRHGNHPHMRPMAEILFDHSVDLLVSGHDHIYERFEPIDADGKAHARGLRQFVVGTGGAEHYRIGALKPHSAVRDASSHGVIKFTLHENSYDWEFVAAAGNSFRDRGSAACHGVATLN
jgi:hypothetical protein